MRKPIFFILVTVVLLFLQRIWMLHFPILSTAPDLVLIALIYFGIFREPVGGLFCAFLLGFVTDIISGIHPGLFATIYTLVFAFMRLAGKQFFLRSIPFQIIAAFTVTVLAKAMEFGILWVSDVDPGVNKAIFISFPAQLLLNVISAPFVIKLMWWVEDISTKDYPGRSMGFDTGW